MMSKIDYLTLLCGEDILLKSLNLIIHQPKIKEISFIGEETFFKMISFLLIEKKNIIDTLSEKIDRAEVEAAYSTLTEYEVFYTIASTDKKKSEDDISMRDGAIQIFMILFPDYQVSFEENGIYFIDNNNNFIVIDKYKYESLRDSVKEILCLDGLGGEEDYNPVSDKAKEIAEKLKARKRKLAGEKEKNKNVLANYVSSLSIGTSSYNLDSIKDLTLFQLYDQVKRYGAWKDSELRIQMQLAGAKDVESKDWFGPLGK